MIAANRGKLFFKEAAASSAGRYHRRSTSDHVVHDIRVTPVFVPLRTFRSFALDSLFGGKKLFLRPSRITF